MDVNQLMEQMLLLNANLLKITGIRVQSKLHPDLPLIKASEDQLKQVFMNLISNAAESMAPTEGGKLTLTTAQQDNRVAIQIADTGTGTGIPEVSIPKIFEPCSC